MTDCLLEIKNLTVTFNNSNRQTKALDDCSFKIYEGETLGLVGESGSGKSLCALSILDLLPNNARRTGQIIFNNSDITSLNEKQMLNIRGGNISMIFQEPMTALNPLHTIKRQLAEVLQLHSNLDSEQISHKTIELLMRVGIKKPHLRIGCYPHQLSGGQRQRILIAIALACRPQLLIADEPTTALDVTVQKQILELLRELQDELKMTVLFISHDLHTVKKISDNLCVMKRGNIVEKGNTKKVFVNPQHSYTKALIDAEPKGDIKTDVSEAPVLIDAQKISVWFPVKRGFFKKTVDHIKAVTDVSFYIRKGETLGIVGESGSGKTTIALALLKLYKHQGIIKFNNKNISAMSEKTFKPYRHEMQIVFQDPFGSLSPRMNVEQILKEGLEVQDKVSKNKWHNKILNALTDVGLSEACLNRYPHEFSGGQRQRIAIARVLVLRPTFIILDEPSSALDRTVQVQIISLLQNLQRKYNLSYLFISHDLAVIKALSHRVMVMQAGKIIEHGETDEVFNNPQDPYTRELIQSSL
jgi:microcin C transport system ATP-binding protein